MMSWGYNVPAALARAVACERAILHIRMVRPDIDEGALMAHASNIASTFPGATALDVLDGWVQMAAVLHYLPFEVVPEREAGA